MSPNAWFLPRRGACRAALMSLLCLVCLAGAASAEDYRLDVMDKLHVRVVEWQTAEGTFRDWTALTGDYTVGPDGTLSLPFVGQTKAVGKTTADIAQTIGDSLQQKFGLSNRPDASVEMAEFRPIFLSGDVQTPGRYPYAPDLSVLKAISLAGGARRTPDSSRDDVRNFINSKGNYSVFSDERNRLYAKRARLAAEAGNKDKIETPKELADAADGAALMAEEQSVMQARTKRLNLQLAQIEDLKSLLKSEIESLEKKSETQTRQVALSREELKGIGNLADKGLVVNSRVLALEQSIADGEGKVLDLDTASLRAKQDINKADQDATTLSNDRDSDIAETQQQVEADLASLDLKIGMHRDLMAEALIGAPEAAARTAQNGQVPLTYTIVRTAGGKTSEITADETTPVKPGDVIKVALAGLPTN